MERCTGQHVLFFNGIICIVCVRIIGTLTTCTRQPMQLGFSELGEGVRAKKKIFPEHRRWQHRRDEYILDLHGSMSMSSDTLYSNCPFIRSSMEYFPYRPLVCSGPINSDLFTLYALVANADCIKYNAIEMTKTERDTGRCERILPIVIICLLFCWDAVRHQSPNTDRIH